MFLKYNTGESLDRSKYSINLDSAKGVHASMPVCFLGCMGHIAVVVQPAGSVWDLA